jgi:DNA-nicking Smr family endonuclease
MSPRKTRNAATVSEEDVRLFEQAVGKVRRMIDPGVLPARPQPPPEPVQSRLDEARVPAELMRSLIDPAEIEVGEELSYLKPGLSPRLLRRLKRGHFSIADEIDLHQMTTEVARWRDQDVSQRMPARRQALREDHSWQGTALTRAGTGLKR